MFMEEYSILDVIDIIELDNQEKISENIKNILHERYVDKRVTYNEIRSFKQDLEIEIRLLSKKEEKKVILSDISIFEAHLESLEKEHKDKISERQKALLKILFQEQVKILELRYDDSKNKGSSSFKYYYEHKDDYCSFFINNIEQKLYTSLSQLCSSFVRKGFLIKCHKSKGAYSKFRFSDELLNILVKEVL